MSASVTPGNTQQHPSAASDAEQSIARVGGAITAFIGRTLRGPINQPVHVKSFTEFQQTFGGLWQPSPLSYAIEHFFEQGGVHAVVVRVINGGAPPTISLPCTEGSLTLRAISPGTREFLRAAVDYDNLAAHGGDDNEHTRDCFNLIVQRVRSQGSERIEVQETYRRVSINPSTQRYVANVLMESKLVRVHGETPASRPLPTIQPGARQLVGYANSNNDGDDGAPLTDYDIIGSATDHTGLFALKSVDLLGYVYIPPLARDVEIGPSILFVAERYCRERRALLIVDPPPQWTSVEQAIAGMHALPLHSEHAVMYFPRLIATDRLRARSEAFPNGGAVAGMLARCEEQRPIWALSTPEPEHVLRSGVRLQVALSEIDRWRLATQGINTLRSTRSTGLIRLVPRTLAGGVNSAIDWGYIGPQRLASFIVNSIERGTRWAIWSKCEPAIWPRITRQATDFLADLATLGAFPAAPIERAYMVVCDRRVNSEADISAGRVNILVAIAGSRHAVYHGFLISHSASGSSIKPVTVNQLEMPVVQEPQIASVADIETYSLSYAAS